MGSRSTWTLHLTDYDGPGKVVNSRLRTFTTHAESDAIGDRMLDFHFARALGQVCGPNLQFIRKLDQVGHSHAQRKVAEHQLVVRRIAHVDPTIALGIQIAPEEPPQLIQATQPSVDR